MTAELHLAPGMYRPPISDNLTSNGARLCQSNSSGCGIYWLSQAKRGTRGQKQNQISSPVSVSLLSVISVKKKKNKGLCPSIRSNMLKFVLSLNPFFFFLFLTCAVLTVFLHKFDFFKKWNIQQLHGPMFWRKDYFHGSSGVVQQKSARFLTSLNFKTDEQPSKQNNNVGCDENEWQKWRFWDKKKKKELNSAFRTQFFFLQRRMEPGKLRFISVSPLKNLPVPA